MTAIAVGMEHSLVIAAGPPSAAEPSDLRPKPLHLEAVYPNPSSGAVTIRYAVEDAGAVALEVVDLLGRRVAVVVEGHAGPGMHAARIEAGPLAAGMYLVRLRSGGEQVTRWLTIAR